MTTGIAREEWQCHENTGMFHSMFHPPTNIFLASRDKLQEPGGTCGDSGDGTNEDGSGDGDDDGTWDRLARGRRR
jgi:hypothetical protein